MDIYMIILRLIHFFAGTFWVGASALLVLVISPAIKKMGPDGVKFMQNLNRMPSFGMFFPILALLTVISGALMYWEVSDGFNADWMELDSSIVLSIGAVAGILAFLHGGGTLGRASGKMNELAKAVEGQGGPPTPEQQAELIETAAYFELHSRISFGLMIVAVAGMASARYF